MINNDYYAPMLKISYMIFGKSAKAEYLGCLISIRTLGKHISNCPIISLTIACASVWRPQGEEKPGCEYRGFLCIFGGKVLAVERIRILEGCAELFAEQTLGH